MKIDENVKRVLRLFVKQRGYCPYTGLALMPFIEHGMVNLDHIQPQSKGGPTDESNLALVPTWVNDLKKDMTRDEFINYLAKNKLATIQTNG